jgi:hypothetical protein
MPEKDFLEWINSEAMNSSEIPNNSDTIYRQAAIDALELKKDKNAKGDIGGFYNKIIKNDIDTLMQLPSAQPEKRTEKRTETHARDCISRQAAIRIASGYCHPANIAAELSKLPSAQPEPKTGRCKDCKWWKDSDGLYRRGGYAESQCPINRREVFEGEGYCYMFEPQESEEKQNEDL